METVKQYIVEALYLLPGIVLALSLHEFSHAYVSSRLGDPLPKASGRLSLNPMRHIDIFGLLMLFLVRFGWAKPVMIDPRFYKRKKLGTALTALAGPAANLLLGFALMIFYFGVQLIAFYAQVSGWWEKIIYVVLNILSYGVLVSVGLGIFNLIPVSPLDGSKVLGALLPIDQYNRLLRYENYGFIILILLLLDVPARLLTAGGIPASVSQYFGLYYYLNAARSFVINTYYTLISSLFSLFIR
jgi:Zn-dependent protease